MIKWWSFLFWSKTQTRNQNRPETNQKSTKINQNQPKQPKTTKIQPKINPNRLNFYTISIINNHFDLPHSKNGPVPHPKYTKFDQYPPKSTKTNQIIDLFLYNHFPTCHFSCHFWLHFSSQLVRVLCSTNFICLQITFFFELVWFWFWTVWTVTALWLVEWPSHWPPIETTEPNFSSFHPRPSLGRPKITKNKIGVPNLSPFAPIENRSTQSWNTKFQFVTLFEKSPKIGRLKIVTNFDQILLKINQIWQVNQPNWPKSTEMDPDLSPPFKIGW